MCCNTCEIKIEKIKLNCHFATKFIKNVNVNASIMKVMIYIGIGFFCKEMLSCVLPLSNYDIYVKMTFTSISSQVNCQCYEYM